MYAANKDANAHAPPKISDLSSQLSEHGLERVINVVLSYFILKKTTKSLTLCISCYSYVITLVITSY